MWHHDVTNPRTCQFSAVCLTVFPFEFRPRTFTIGFYGKNSIISELMILECSFPLTSVPNFMEIVQAVKKLNSISRERLNFRRRPILCTTLYRNPMQARNFGGTFDQLFLRIFYQIFTEDASLLCLYHGAKKSKMTKNSNKGGSCLNHGIEKVERHLL